MKKIAKVMAVMLCMALLVCGGIFGTLAYLTSQTPTLTNRFTVGNVSISLSECLVDGNGKKLGESRIQTTQEYKLVPGGVYDKDPTIHVNYGSEKCFLYARINNEIGADKADETKESTVQQLTRFGWVKLDVDTGKTTETIWYYEEYGEAGKDYILFEKIYIDPSLTDMSELDGKKIEITAYAVQTEGFVTAENTHAQNALAAWNSTFGAPATPGTGA